MQAAEITKYVPGVVGDLMEDKNISHKAAKTEKYFLGVVGGLVEDKNISQKAAKTEKYFLCVVGGRKKASHKPHKLNIPLPTAIKNTVISALVLPLFPVFLILRLYLCK